MNLIRKLWSQNPNQIDKRVGTVITDQVNHSRTFDGLFLQIRDDSLLDRIESLDANLELLNKSFVRSFIPLHNFLVEFVGGITDFPRRADFLAGNQTLIVRKPRFLTKNLLEELENLKRRYLLNPNSYETRFLDDYIKFVKELISINYSFEFDLQENISFSIIQGVSFITSISNLQGYSSGKNTVEEVRNIILSVSELIKIGKIDMDGIIRTLNAFEVETENRNRWEVYFVKKILARFLFEIINSSPVQATEHLSLSLKEFLRICIEHRAPSSRMVDPKSRRPGMLTKAEEWYEKTYGILPEKDLGES